MDVLFSIFIATYALSGAQFCNLAELPQAQSIEVVRIYVQQMIGRNEWGQDSKTHLWRENGCIAFTCCLQIITFRYLLNSSKFLYIFPIDTVSTQSLTVNGVRVKSTFGIARILKSDTYISLSMKNVNWGSVGTCLLSIFLRRRGEF